MIDELACKITYYIEKNGHISTRDDLEKIEYSLKAILSEVFKTLILIALFFIIGGLNYFLLSMSILCSIRIFAGGYHCSTTVRCLFCSILFFLTTFLAGYILPRFHTGFYYISGLVSVLIVLFKAPYPNKKRPIKNKKRRLILKLCSIFFTIFWVYILLFYIKDTCYLNCGFITILLQVLQLIFKIRR